MAVVGQAVNSPSDKMVMIIRRLIAPLLVDAIHSNSTILVNAKSRGTLAALFGFALDVVPQL